MCIITVCEFVCKKGEIFMYKKFMSAFLVAMFALTFSGAASAVELISETPKLSELQTNEVPAVSVEEFSDAIVEVKNGNSEPEAIIKMENLPKVKNVSSNMVTITTHKVIIPSGSVFKIAFAQDFTTKNLKVGDKVMFNLPEGLFTQEGRMLLPCDTQIVAVVKTYQSPKWFNRNAKVTMDFYEILVPNSVACSMGACVYAKDNVLQRSKLATIMKPIIWTVGLFGIGAGAGAGIGAAAGSVGIGCFAIGMPVGGGLGLIIGLVTPGLHYKARAGKQIPIVLNKDMFLQHIPVQ